MNIKALVTALVLGSSSLAVAAPLAPVVRDHRAPAPAYVGFRAPTKPVLSWVTLADNTKLYGRTVIEVAPTARKFTKLELRADWGRASIDKVTIVFANGRSQVVNLDTTLSTKQPSIAIDLTGDARSIDRIVLVGRTLGRHASLDVRAI